MKTVRTWCIRILMILFTIIFLYPLFWNLMSAFKTNAEYLTDPYALPHKRYSRLPLRSQALRQ